MKKLNKLIISIFFVFLINTFIQTKSYSHGVLSFFGIFTSVLADEHTAEKQVIKELKIKIYNLDEEPIKRKLIQSDKKYIIDLKNQLNELIKLRDQKNKELAEKQKKE